jgi:cytosine/adenosine deaminase-related metal-dependent hydrolase
VTVDGDRIAAVEPRGVRAADVDLGNVAVIPGLVNAHTHLDLSGARGRTPPTDAAHFTDWLRSVIAYRRSRTPAEVQADVRAGLAECLAAGTTLVGDITAGGASYPAVSAAAVRATVFWELIGLSRERFRAALDAMDRKTRSPAPEWPDTPRVRWGRSPHAPYSANHDEARAYLWGGATIHLAESPAELELLAGRAGPFVPFLQSFGIWDPDEFRAGLGDFLVEPAPDRGGLFVHCNYLPPDTPFAPNQSVVYCPRTHAAFGHPPHPFRDFLARGVRVCLGTDGLTSNPDLDILAEARFVAAKYPDFPGDQLLRMVTLSGAEALGWADECGSLEPGKSVDLVAVPLPDRDGDPHALLFGADCGPRATWFRGGRRG